ncbi:hypothetical protein SNE40_003044 [Patella caerulea]
MHLQPSTQQELSTTKDKADGPSDDDPNLAIPDLSAFAPTESKQLDIERIITAKYQGDKRQYRVKVKDQRETIWCPAHKIDQDLIQDFHIRKTISGKRRKRPLQHKYFTRSRT